MKHKHAELIKAWADGVEIEYYNIQLDIWVGIESPIWSAYTTYRIKPEPKPDVVRYVACDVRFGGYDVTPSKYEGDNLKLTFDGETGKLKSAEVIS